MPRQPSVYASLPSLTRSQARLEAGMKSLLLFRRAFTSPAMCRFIPALSVTRFPDHYRSGPYRSLANRPALSKSSIMKRLI